VAKIRTRIAAMKMDSAGTAKALVLLVGRERRPKELEMMEGAVMLVRNTKYL
jgi:hypothetical protein